MLQGGREHGVPILISELEDGGPAALTGELYACHKEAVQALQSVKGDCALCVQYIATDDDDRLSEDNYRFPLYPDDADLCEERDGSGVTPTAPRTPDFTASMVKLDDEPVDAKVSHLSPYASPLMARLSPRLTPCSTPVHLAASLRKKRKAQRDFGHSVFG
ncbi:unnamed protein product [Leptidea sinapis]|uniref:PDZ domain-containing protein n=1 Tax=Leptidea sinapis TaxID=189913 RepID=A0A5E4PVW3_9NEOP|nr:unnamed protein product [Leptidea sinapis]